MDDRQLKRAGLDYHELAHVQVHRELGRLPHRRSDERRMFALCTRGTRSYAEVEFRVGDAFVFGAETQGPAAGSCSRNSPGDAARLPMLAGNRSLNLSNAVAVVVFEAWRQIGFLGSAYGHR